MTYYENDEKLIKDMPLSDDIVKWVNANDDVRESLKILVHERFIPIRAISWVNEPFTNGMVVQSVGIYSIDRRQEFKIKQDYIMKQTSGDFILFTGLPSDKHYLYGKNVKKISDLTVLYGIEAQSFRNEHHKELSSLSPRIKILVKKTLSEVTGLDRASC